MSSYMYFFARVGNEFAPINMFSRSCYIYDAVSSYAPYEQVAPLSSSKIDDFVEEVEFDTRRREEEIENAKQRIEILSKSQLGVDELISGITEEQGYITTLRQDISEMEEARSFLLFLKQMNEQWSWGAYKKFTYDKYIYVGVECGFENLEIQDE